MRKIIAVDFDGCLVADKWPEIGEPVHDTILALQKEIANSARVILWTCREGAALREAVAWCDDSWIVLDAVNENLPGMIARFGNDTRKVFADEYWDDKARRMPTISD